MHPTIQSRIQALRQDIVGFPYVASGTVLTRRMRCGNPTCRCKKNKAWWHGPYHNWTRMQRGRFVHQYLNADEAKMIRQAILNYRTIHKLLRLWEHETIRAMKTLKKKKS